MKPDAPRQRLYLFTPIVDDTEAFAPQLDTALGSADIAAVLLRLAEADERTLINRAKAIAAAAQQRNVALLLDGRAGIVARAGADGSHLSGIETLAAALALLKPDRIAGAGGLRSRHDAMLAAEAGADYVMFGEPYPGEEDRRPPLQETLERLEWSAELLQLPCVGYAGDTDEVTAVARTGADFVALGAWLWNEPQGAAAAVAAAAQNLAAPVPR